MPLQFPLNHGDDLGVASLGECFAQLQSAIADLPIGGYYEKFRIETETFFEE